MFGTNNYTNPYWNPSYTQIQQPQPQQSNSNITWIQGEPSAKSFAVAPGQTVLLMDSESNVFYIKSSDASGMPMPLRTFDYKERVDVAKNATPSTDNYVTREEFEKRLKEITDGKHTVPTA